MNILFCSSEVHPLIKTGGLADVSGSLPKALRAMGQDVRIFLPGYESVIQMLGKPRGTFRLAPEPGGEQTYLLEYVLPGTDIPLYLLDAPRYFRRAGNPYSQPNGEDWADNGARFGYFCQVIAKISLNKTGLHWKPDVLHCNDWQTALAPAILHALPNKPKSLFTIHNMAYQGIFPRALFDYLHLAPNLWSMDGVEFHGSLSFLKGGLVYADSINAVSPNYAREIQTPEFGCGLDGLLQYHQEKLTGILNGVDYDHWHPETDVLIEANYSAQALEGKGQNKSHLQKRMGLPVDPNIMLMSTIGRLVPQKGIDLILDLIPTLRDRGVQLVILGSGSPEIEAQLHALSESESSWMKFQAGYNEPLAHQIEAGSDLFLMPSRFEPCGLNQIYSLAYGTLPLVRNTGGLADTVIGWNPPAVVADRATGFMFEEPTALALLASLDQAIALFQQQDKWQNMVSNAMTTDFSWPQSANHYLALYQKMLDEV